MKIIRPLGFLLFMLTIAATNMTANAQVVYKSVGPDGKITFSDHPPATGKVVQTMKFDAPSNSNIPVSAQATKSQVSTSAAVTKNVNLYSASWCGYCKMAKAYLAKKGIAYTDHDVDTESGKSAYVQAGGSQSIPYLVVDGRHIKGFSTESYDSFFANR